jgi:hypothetical protein
MADTERIYGWVKEKSFSYPLPSKIKIGSPTEILNQIEYYKKLYLYDETRNGTYDSWQYLQNGSAFRQEENDDGSITFRPIHLLELLYAAEHDLKNADLRNLKKKAEKLGEELSDEYNVNYCGYYINVSNNEKFLRLNNRHSVPVFWVGDRVCVYLVNTEVDKNTIKKQISIPKDFILRIHKQEENFPITKGFWKKGKSTVVELYRHSHFIVADRQVDEKRMKQLIQEHNKSSPKCSIDKNVNQIEFFTKKEW